MNLDDFLNGNNGIDVDAETLPQVYGLDDDAVVSKVKRLVKASFECSKDHEVVEMIRAESNSDVEAVVVAHLIGKFFIDNIIESSQSTLNDLASALAMAVASASVKLDLDEGSVAILLESLSEAFESVSNNN